MTGWIELHTTLKRGNLNIPILGLQFQTNRKSLSISAGISTALTWDLRETALYQLSRP